MCKQMHADQRMQEALQMCATIVQLQLKLDGGCLRRYDGTYS